MRAEQESEFVESEVPRRCWLDPNVQLRPSPIEGLGLFSTASINRGELGGVLGGRVIDDAELARISATGERYDSAAIGEGVNILLEPGEPLARGNHSCDSNMWLRNATSLEACRHISPGDELTIDYALLTATPRVGDGMSLWRRVMPPRCSR
jgi:hypothetical protein